MFRKFTDRISAAASAAANAVAGGGDEQGVQALQSMGFTADQARQALQATNGNVDQAAELLLASGVAGSTIGSSSSAPPPPTSHNNSNSSSDADIQRAMEASLQAEEQRQLEQARKVSAATTPLPLAPTSAAVTKAGQAAVRRAANGQEAFQGNKNKTTVCSTHTNVKVPAKLQHKSKEEQLLRCADRMKAHPRAVDTISICLTAIQKDPSADKYRKIDKTTAGYQRSLQNAPGAQDMLKAMNFSERGTTHLILHREHVDAALLYLGISALEKVRETEEYKDGKRKLQFAKEVETLFSESNQKEEVAANYRSKLPAEPTGGRGALITVQIADKDPMRRKFDGDDTLQDVLNWLGGVSSTSIPEKLLSRQWSLVDLNRYNSIGAPMDCEEDGNHTLQYLGLFPSGRLEIVLSTEEWQQEKKCSMERGSARGLGAASRLSA